MSGAEWTVVSGGFALIGWINWYFFLAGASVARAAHTPSHTPSHTSSHTPTSAAPNGSKPR